MRRNSSASTSTGSNDKESKGSLADSNLSALNTALQKVLAERIYAQNLWEQANNSSDIGLPQILEDSCYQSAAWAARRIDG